MKKIRFYKKTLAVPALLLFLTGRDADIGITAEPETVEEFRKAVGGL